jgi:hypothetical protein
MRNKIVISSFAALLTLPLLANADDYKTRPPYGDKSAPTSQSSPKTTSDLSTDRDGAGGSNPASPTTSGNGSTGNGSGSTSRSSGNNGGNSNGSNNGSGSSGSGTSGSGSGGGSSSGGR